MAGGGELDAFLVFTTPLNGAPEIQGETLDEAFASQKAIDIDSFEFGDTNDLDPSGKSDLSDGKNFLDDYIDGKLDTKELAKEFEDEEGQKEEAPDAQFVEIKKKVDSSSPHLFVAYCQANSSTEGDKKFGYDKATVTIRRASSPKFTLCSFEMRTVYVAGYSLNTNDDGPPTETIKIFFTEVTMTYYPQKHTGAQGEPVIVSWPPS